MFWNVKSAKRREPGSRGREPRVKDTGSGNFSAPYSLLPQRPAAAQVTTILTLRDNSYTKKAIMQTTITQIYNPDVSRSRLWSKIYNYKFVKLYRQVQTLCILNYSISFHIKMSKISFPAERKGQHYPTLSHVSPFISKSRCILNIELCCSAGARRRHYKHDASKNEWRTSWSNQHSLFGAVVMYSILELICQKLALLTEGFATLMLVFHLLTT